MSQHFPPNSNALLRWLLVGGGVFAVLFVFALVTYARTTNNRVGVPVSQPIEFKHSLHAGELGLDCRFCHTTVEVAASAGIPPTETCMGCHSQIRVDTPQLAAVRASFDTGQPIEWNRVHNLPDYAYFNHSAHVNNGVGCSSCHGPVDRMEGMWKTETMTMGWCLDCHRQPETQVRPLNEVFNMSYKAPKDQLALGTELVASYHINTDKLPQCSTCHR